MNQENKVQEQPFKLFSPTEKQKLFLKSNAFEKGFGGGAGGGKSKGLLIDAMIGLKHRGYRALLLRRKLVDLKKSGALIDMSQELFRGRAKYNAQDHVWNFPNNCKIEFGHCQTIKDLDNYYSSQYQYIGIDQVEQFTLEMYLYFFSRCRSTNPDIDCHIVSTFNPVGIGRNWIRNRFRIGKSEPNVKFPITEEILFPNGEKKSMTYNRVYIPALVFDNPHV